MPMNRVQFQKGLSLPDFMNRYGTEEQCEPALIDDAYLGGERRGGKSGRRSENKLPFVAAVQTTEDGKPHLACLAPRPFIEAALEDFFARVAVVDSDWQEHRC